MEQPKRERPLIAIGILLGVAAIPTVLWSLGAWTNFVLGAQLVVAIAALILSANRLRWGATAAIAGGLAGVVLWAGFRFAPAGTIETLPAAELPGRHAFGFIVTDGRLLLDRRATASFEEEEGCKQMPGEDCFVTYDYTAVALVGDAWKQGEPIPAWIVDKQARKEQTKLGVPERGSIRELPASAPAWPERISGALRRGDVSGEPGEMTEANSQRAVAHAEKKLGLRSAPGALLLRPNDDPEAILEADASAARWARVLGFGSIAACGIVFLGSFVWRRRARARGVG